MIDTDTEDREAALRELNEEFPGAELETVAIPGRMSMLLVCGLCTLGSFSLGGLLWALTGLTTIGPSLEWIVLLIVSVAGLLACPVLLAPFLRDG